MMAGEFRKLGAEGKRVKESLKSVADDSSALYKEISKQVTDVKAAARSQIRGVQRRAQEDPKALTRLVVKSVSDAISKSPALKGTKLERVLSGLERKLDNIDDLAKAMEGIGKELLNLNQKNL